MDTLAEIMAAARRLLPAEHSKLRCEIERLEKESRAIRFEGREGEDLGYRLVRLRDDEWRDLLRRSLSIEDQSLAVYWLIWAPSAPIQLSLPAAYLTLKHLSGESGHWFDDYKSSFSFPFALEVQRAGRMYPYLFEARNYGDGLEFPVRRVVDPRDRRLEEHLVHAPFEREFGREEIRGFLLRFVTRLSGVWEVIRKRPHEPFVQAVPKRLVVFGCCGGKVFEKYYQREGTYTAALGRYQEQVQQEQERGNRKARRRLVARAEGAPVER
jgi:hypothetical protein